MRRFSWIVTGLAMLGLPLLGAYWLGVDIGSLFVYPPEFGRVEHSPFKIKLTLLILTCLSGIPVLWYLNKRRDRLFRHNLVYKRRHFPKWGYLGYSLLVLSWALAWTRFEALALVQPYSFTPLWLSFIIIVNAHVHRFSNTAPLYKNPGKFALLFLLSACFWWVFEYLNRFSENWIYSGVEEVSRLHYYLHGSICFSTVLPAVFSVFRLLNCHGGLHRFFYLGPRVSPIKNRAVSLILVLVGLFSLVGVGVYPNYCYPFLWAGPVLVFGGMQGILNQMKGLNRWARGDWRWVSFWAIAGLICGFFWECWNFFSLFKWQYSLSFFNGLHVFEMPLLGYLGYLPFGVLCGLVTQWLFPQRASIEFSPN
ncbi:MAG: hypothetical protein O7C75_18665 [Verrucomicrobia bacterium]|nr:hypothetical protein [Verrucomicrobiota bacterium]